jgi:hypothetical protein
VKDLCVYWVAAMAKTIERKDKDYMSDWRYENEAKAQTQTEYLNLNAGNEGETELFIQDMYMQYL